MEDVNTEITPLDFELLAKNHIEGLGQEIKSYRIEHNKSIQVNDGTYQIDIYVEFEVMGVIIKILVECKKYGRKVERYVVQVLHSKIKSTSSHKGIIFSTNGFQEGARQYAKEHGIALIHVVEGRLTYFTKSMDSDVVNIPSFDDDPKYVGEFTHGNSTALLQDGYYDTLRDFLFGQGLG